MDIMEGIMVWLINGRQTKADGKKRFLGIVSFRDIKYG
jgi:hypothetical protein